MVDERVFVDRRSPTITNHVVTLTMGVHFDLRRVALRLPSTEHKPDTFAAITMRIDGVTALVFATGKVVVTGAKTEAASQLAAHRFRLFLERIPQPVVRRDENGAPYISIESLREFTRFDAFSVVNIVGSGRAMDGAISLCTYKQNTHICTEWEPALFPGMRLIIARCAECPLVKVDQIMAHVFDTGRCVIMGARCPEDVYAGQRYLTEIMKPFFDPDAPVSSEKRFRYRLEQLLKNKNVCEAPKKKRSVPRGLEDTPVACLERVLDREELAIVERMARQETADDEDEAREAAEREAVDREDGDD
jgi:transcription initiation factor TFIID TATA-box-binding protein